MNKYILSLAIASRKGKFNNNIEMVRKKFQEETLSEKQLNNRLFIYLRNVDLQSTLNIGSAFSWKTLLDLPCPDRGFNITSTLCGDLHLIGGWSNKDSLRGLSES